MQEDALIAALYRALLGRDPEPGAQAYWSDIIASQGAVAAVEGIMSSDEARSRIKPVQDGETAVIKAASRDVILKEIGLPTGAAGWLALPLRSQDPIVALYIGGHAENNYMLELLLELTAPGDHVLDLGAHVGTFSVPAALMGRQVLAIDAARQHVELLEISRRVNDLSSLSVVHCAVSYKDGPVGFHEDGLFGRVDFTGVDRDASMRPGRRLDGLLDEHGVRHLAFIKADIEGSELHALRTLAGMLGEDDGPPILFESNAETFNRAGYSVQEMRRWLEEIGYRTFRVEGGRWIYAPPEQMQPELWVDMLALKPRHQQKFSGRIDWEWTQEAIRDCCLKWASLPWDSTRLHLIGVLEAAEALRSTCPETKKLLEELRHRQTGEGAHV